MGTLVQRKGRFQGWEYTETMAAGTNSDPIAIPPLGRGRNISVTTVITSGEGKVQFTTSPDAVLETTAVWQDWPEGTNTTTFSDTLFGPVTGLRLVRVSGTVIIEIII